MESKSLRVLVIAKLADRTLDGYLVPIVNVENVRAQVLRSTPGSAITGVTYTTPPLALQRNAVLSFVWKLFMCIRLGLTARFSCVYAIFAYPHLYLASLIAFLSRKPLYYTLIAADYELVGRGSILQKLTMKLARRAIKIIVSGDKAIQILLQQGIPVKNIVEYRITSLVDLTAFVNMGIDRPIDLVVVSRLAEDKNIHVFVDIVNSVKRTRPNVRAAIVGDGVLMDNLVEYVKAKGLSENIKFYGWLSDPAAVNKILNSAKIFVMNSSHEGGPFSVPEAMAAGLCVVSSDVGEVRKIIHHGQDGFIIDRFDDTEEYVSIIKQMLENPEQLQKIQQSAAQIKKREGNSDLKKFWIEATAHLRKS